ncbi:MAG: flagellar motor protein MotB [Candidatus Ozemobacteraceae bacterium]
MPKRKKKQPPHENLERWLLTYADMITLLMAFFIMLYTMSKVDTSKLKAVGEDLRVRFGYFPASFPGGGTSVSKTFNTTGQNGPALLAPTTNLIPYSDKTIMAQFSKYLKRERLENHVKVRQTERGVLFSIMSDGVLFDKREVSLRPDAKKVLDSVGLLLSGLENDIQVEGHTDEAFFLDKSQLNGNWNLSAARGLCVLSYMVQQKFVPESRINFAAFSSNKPVTDPGISEEDRHKLNRRVDLLIIGPQNRKNRQRDDFFQDSGLDEKTHSTATGVPKIATGSR